MDTPENTSLGDGRAQAGSEQAGSEQAGSAQEGTGRENSAKERRGYRRHGSRYKARRRASDILFEAEARDTDPVALVEEREQLSGNPDNGVAPIAAYTRTIVEGVAVQLDEIDEAIARFLSEDWELDRLPAVDRAILRVGAWEIMYNDEVDTPTAVVEAVELASQYSTTVAAPYIHAVLDDIAQSLAEGAPVAESDDSAEADADAESEISTEASAGAESSTESDAEMVSEEKSDAANG